MKVLLDTSGGGGNEKELELFIPDLWLMDRLDIELPMPPIDRGFCEGVLLGHGLDVAAAPQFTELG